jgi:hypothetical protein
MKIAIKIGDRVRHKISGDLGIVESVNPAGMTDCARSLIRSRPDAFPVTRAISPSVGLPSLRKRNTVS